MVCDRYIFFKLAKIFHARDFREDATGHGNGGGRWAAEVGAESSSGRLDAGVGELLSAYRTILGERRYRRERM